MFTANHARSKTFRRRFRQTFARIHSLFHSRYSLTHSRYSLIHSRTFLTTFLKASCARRKRQHFKSLRRWLRLRQHPEVKKCQKVRHRPRANGERPWAYIPRPPKSAPHFNKTRRLSRKPPHFRLNP
jgi:hypothetical protein